MLLDYIKKQEKFLREEKFQNLLKKSNKEIITVNEKFYATNVSRDSTTLTELLSNEQKLLRQRENYLEEVKNLNGFKIIEDDKEVVFEVENLDPYSCDLASSSMMNIVIEREENEKEFRKRIFDTIEVDFYDYQIEFIEEKQKFIFTIKNFEVCKYEVFEFKFVEKENSKKVRKYNNKETKEDKVNYLNTLYTNKLIINEIKG